MDAVFVERQFELAGEARVIVRFFRPELDDDAYRCDYKIIWPDRERTFNGVGVDGVQALILAMKMAHADLLSSPEAKAGHLSWLGEGDLGLPSALEGGD
jgi:hypothetical protein